MDEFRDYLRKVGRLGLSCLGPPVREGDGSGMFSYPILDRRQVAAHYRDHRKGRAIPAIFWASSSGNTMSLMDSRGTPFHSWNEASVK